MTIVDPQNRIRYVEFQTQAGTGPVSAWVRIDPPGPYTASVARIDGQTSTIRYRVTYQNCAGDLVTDLTGERTFPLAFNSIIEAGDFVYEGDSPLIEYLG